MRALLSLILCLGLALPALAQDTQATSGPDRAATGGAQTLEDILARQQGEQVDSGFRRNATGTPDDAAGMAGQLGTLGGASDAEVWRALRYGLDDVKVSSGGPEARVLIQDRGMWWLQLRTGPAAQIGGYAIIGVLVLLIAVYAIKGKQRVSAGMSGRTVLRHTAFARFSHWLLATSFIALSITGLVVLFGRSGLIPWMGPEAYSALARGSKFVHNNVGFAFMLSLVFIFVIWAWDNIPDRTDARWIAAGGGMIGDGHPSSGKFNAGEKMVFWLTVGLGALVSVTGLSLIFPFELPMFAWAYGVLNATGLPELIGLGALPEQLAPHEEMQFAQLAHLILGFVMMVIIMGHIFMGAFWIEGALDGMVSGEVDENWAWEHHDLWARDMQEKGMITQGSDPHDHGGGGGHAKGAAQPAE